MKGKLCLLALAALVCGTALVMLPAAEPTGKEAGKKRPQPEKIEIAKLRITGPHVHDNLAIFLIHGRDRVKGKKFITLSQALKKKRILIRETGNVGQLTVENTGEDTIYIQSGEIVKGGKQDRMLPYDAVIPPKSGKKPIASFCVEHGRWSRRGNESVGYFLSSANAASNAIVLAGKLQANQGNVWREVSRHQGRLNVNAAANVRAAASPSSLQLSLENKKPRPLSVFSAF